MYDGSPEERRAIRAEHLEGPGDFAVLLTHYDLVIRDKSLLRKVLRVITCAGAIVWIVARLCLHSWWSCRSACMAQPASLQSTCTDKEGIRSACCL